MSGTSGSSSRSSRGRAYHGWAPTPSKTAHTPAGLVKKYNLPIAAYLHAPDVPSGLDLSRPLLLFKNLNSTKVRAISLRVMKESGLSPVGPPLVIPDSYTGWFSVITPDGRTAPYYSTIEKVASAQVPFFLTRFDIPAYVRAEDSADSSRVTYQRTTVQSGHVLKLLGIFEDLNARRNLLGVRNTPCNKYAQCLNHCNEVLFVPFSAKGRFYATAHRGTRSTTSNVFLMSQLLSTFKLPLTIRLVCGYMPRVPHAFTGILRLEKSQKETVILACTMTSEAKATLLEMDISSNFILSPVTDPLFTKSPVFLKTVSYCMDEADSWRRQIKVTHHLTEDSSGSSLGRSSDRNYDSHGSSSSPLSLPFFVDLDRRRGRVRDRSRTREFLRRDKSRDIWMSDRGKENIEKRGREKSKVREKSRDTRFKDIVKDKLQDMTRNRPCTVSGEFVSIKVDEKVSEKNNESRKISKQNTYIFQNKRNLKFLGNKKDKTSEVVHAQQRSVENQEYSTVLDDITTIRESEDDSLYAEIEEHKRISDSRSGIVRINSRDKTRNSIQTSSDFRIYTSSSSAEEDNVHSFTLLKKDLGKFYVSLPGLGFHDSGRFSKQTQDYSNC